MRLVHADSGGEQDADGSHVRHTRAEVLAGSKNRMSVLLATDKAPMQSNETELDAIVNIADILLRN